jgi:tRNA pseudouridine38-40 synthase
MVHPRRVQLLVRFGYDGSRFHGLQPQRDLPTAGGALRIRLEEAFGERARALCFAARTDAGVHALRNAATCWVPRPITDEVLAAIHAPRDDGLRCVRPEIVPINVHARGSARGKRYRYLIDHGAPADAMDGRFSWAIAPRVDVARMNAAAACLVGEHDFSAFRAARCEARNPVKVMSRVSVDGPWPLPGGRERVVVEIAGSAFLRKMVRILVGTLVEVGAGLRAPGEVADVLASRDRRRGGLTAPARGLTLLEVALER